MMMRTRTKMRTRMKTRMRTKETLSMRLKDLAIYVPLLILRASRHGSIGLESCDAFVAIETFVGMSKDDCWVLDECDSKDNQ